jgi:cysteine-rich repeat protein
MYLLGPNGSTQLAYDDDDGLGLCSLITPANDPGVRQLQPGTYYVSVNEYQNNAVINAYSIKMTALATCGNGIKEGYEQCDDGNQIPNDTCSNLCKVVTNPEVEPNNTCLTANGPTAAVTGGSAPFSGAITPVGDNDWFSFTLPATADVIFDTFDANGPGTCVATDTEIQVFKSDCATPLGPAQNVGGLGACAKLNPTIDAQVRHLPAGTYYVRVNEYQNNAALAGYTLQATITALCGNGVLEGFEECDGTPGCDPNCDRIPVCGDGLVDAPEVCDDSNAVSGDGCDATCTAVEPNFLCHAGGGPCVTTCGDAMVLASEQCDDGNLVNGDGCDAACTLESPPSSEVEPNNTSPDADARANDPTPILILGREHDDRRRDHPARRRRPVQDRPGERLRGPLRGVRRHGHQLPLRHDDHAPRLQRRGDAALHGQHQRHPELLRDRHQHAGGHLLRPGGGDGQQRPHRRLSPAGPAPDE